MERDVGVDGGGGVIARSFEVCVCMASINRIFVWRMLSDAPVSCSYISGCWRTGLSLHLLRT